MRPLSYGVNKQLLPVYNKPMIFYFKFIDVREHKKHNNSIRQKYLSSYKSLLENGSKFGIKLSYVIQSKPNGSECFKLCSNI